MANGELLFDVVQVHPDTPPEDVQTTWKYLRLANKAVRGCRKEQEFCFLRCHVTLKKNLVLQASLSAKGNMGGRYGDKNSVLRVVGGSSTATQVLVSSFYLGSIVVDSNRAVLQVNISRSTSSFGISTALQ